VRTKPNSFIASLDNGADLNSGFGKAVRRKSDKTRADIFVVVSNCQTPRLSSSIPCKQDPRFVERGFQSVGTNGIMGIVKIDGSLRENKIEKQRLSILKTYPLALSNVGKLLPASIE
jgi:hypothetical protein